MSPSHLHGAVAEELLDVFSRTGRGHALGVGATDVPIGKSEEGGTAVKKENHLNTQVKNECVCMCTWSCVSPTPFYFIYCVVLFVLECFYDERMDAARIALFFLIPLHFVQRQRHSDSDSDSKSRTWGHVTHRPLSRASASSTSRRPSASCAAHRPRTHTLWLLAFTLASRTSSGFCRREGLLWVVVILINSFFSRPTCHNYINANQPPLCTWAH